MMQKLKNCSQSGKPDDITIVSGLVTSDDNATNKKLKSFDWREQINEEREKLFAEHAKDVKCFVENYYNAKYEAKPNPEEHLKHEIYI